tara:strand:- start:182 stop:505 length:324 start_codon:yes stop_codon:yes gene_type:complete
VSEKNKELLSRILLGGFLMSIGLTFSYNLLFDEFLYGDKIITTTRYQGEIFRDYGTYDIGYVIRDVVYFIIGIPFLYVGYTVLFHGNNDKKMEKMENLFDRISQFLK